MISTGQKNLHNSDPATKTTEVVDVVSGEICADLADFPKVNWGTVGANLNGTLIVCGLRKCFKFVNGYWQEFANFNKWRRNAAGVMFKNKFHVFGGYGFPTSPQTSEIISINGEVEYGPKLPEGVLLHAITSINSTVSILSGGVASGTWYSPLTWFFNHETQAFSSGPSLLIGRSGHGSATIVDKVTKAKIPMVTGGYRSGIGTLDSTELLINGQWQSGTRGYSLFM